jgi:hypothetical protein
MWMSGRNIGLAKVYNKIYVGRLKSHRRTIMVLCAINVCDWSNMGSSLFVNHSVGRPALGSLKFFEAAKKVFVITDIYNFFSRFYRMIQGLRRL